MPAATLTGDTPAAPVVTVKLPPAVEFKVETVRAIIETVGAGDVRPTLTVADPSGAELATVEQLRAIPGGGQGSATWALRLDDESAGVPIATKTGVYFNASQNIPPTGAEFAWTFAAGEPLLNLSNTIFPRFKAAGLYSLTATAFYQDPDDAGKLYIVRLRTTADVFQDEASNGGPLITSRALSDRSNTVVGHMPANSVLSLILEHNAAVARRFRMLVYVVKIGA